MRKRYLIIGAIILGLLALPVAWWLGSPLFIDRAVDEAFPFELPTEDEIAGLSPAEADEIVMDAMDTIDEAFVESLPVDQAAELEDKMMAVAGRMTVHEMDEALPDAPVEWALVAEGQFQDADSFHQGSGSARIFQQGDQRVLRFEEFEVTNGPDLHVLLVENVAGNSQDALGTYVDLGSLKGNMGNQNYEIPPDVDLAQFTGVMIYCVPFHVVFSTAVFGG